MQKAGVGTEWAPARNDQRKESSMALKTLQGRHQIRTNQLGLLCLISFSIDFFLSLSKPYHVPESRALVCTKYQRSIFGVIPNLRGRDSSRRWTSLMLYGAS